MLYGTDDIRRVSIRLLLYAAQELENKDPNFQLADFELNRC